jgi:hypothetical protein
VVVGGGGGSGCDDLKGRCVVGVDGRWLASCAMMICQQLIPSPSLTTTILSSSISINQVAATAVLLALRAGIPSGGAWVRGQTGIRDSGGYMCMDMDMYVCMRAREGGGGGGYGDGYAGMCYARGGGGGGLTS